MPSADKYRRTFFALLKALPGTEFLDRHDLQEELTGKRSTREWSAEDWRRAIAALQAETGQLEDADREPRVREDRPHGVASEPGTWATSAQARFVADLEGEIAWAALERGPIEFVLTTVLKPDEKALRRARIRGQQRQAQERGTRLGLGEATRMLTRQEAAHLIQALKGVKRYHPLAPAAS